MAPRLGLPAALLLVAVACTDTTDREAWTDEVRDNFLAACEESSDGQADYCACVLTDLEDTYTLAEFEEIEQHLDAGGEVPGELQATIDTCVEQHVS